MTPTRRQLGAWHAKRLRTMRKAMLEMSAQWEDVDQFCVNRLEELADQLQIAALDVSEDEGK